MQLSAPFLNPIFKDSKQESPKSYFKTPQLHLEKNILFSDRSI